MISKENHSLKNNRRTVKIVICGGKECGKTTLAKRLTNTYNGTAPSKTIGVDLHFLNIHKDVLIEGNLWDVDGPKIPECIFNNVDIVLLVFAFNSKKSFQKLKELYKKIDKFEFSKLMLIGNKKDIPHRKVSDEEVKIFADQHNMEFFKISALKGIGLENLRRKLIINMEEIID